MALAPASPLPAGEGCSPPAGKHVRKEPAPLRACLPRVRACVQGLPREGGRIGSFLLFFHPPKNRFPGGPCTHPLPCHLPQLQLCCALECCSHTPKAVALHGAAAPTQLHRAFGAVWPSSHPAQPLEAIVEPHPFRTRCRVLTAPPVFCRPAGKAMEKLNRCGSKAGEYPGGAGLAPPADCRTG